jgi:hypothetical protein
MKLLREALLSLFVGGVVLYLYCVAAGAALLSLCGFFSHRNGPAMLHHFTVAENLQNRTYTGHE